MGGRGKGIRSRKGYRMVRSSTMLMNKRRCSQEERVKASSLLTNQMSQSERMSQEKS